MDSHFCPICGTACAGGAVVEPVDTGPSDVDRALDTVDHALDVIETMVEEEEETERIEAVADAEVEIVESGNEAAAEIVEALTDDEPEEEPDVVEVVEEPAGETEVEEEPAGETEEPTEEEADAGADEPQAVEVPPQIDDDPGQARPQGTRTVSAFRRRRVKRR